MSRSEGLSLYTSNRLITRPPGWLGMGAGGVFGLTVFGSVLPGIIVLAEAGARRRVGLTFPPGRADAL
jgi:hypothetical protein